MVPQDEKSAGVGPTSPRRVYPGLDRGQPSFRTVPPARILCQDTTGRTSREAEYRKETRGVFDWGSTYRGNPRCRTYLTARGGGAYMTPDSFGPYQLIALIGRGGMGEVYRAYDTRRQRTVALKRLRPQFVADEKFRGRFLKECQRAARLTQAHVIPIHDFGEIDGRLYLDMRLIEGNNVAEALESAGRFAPEHAVEIVRQVAGALDAAHAAGIVHRDVKPSNVLIGANEPTLHCYLADFGVAGAIGDTGGASATVTGGVLGTYDYIAPERLLGRPSDHRVDVYALACMLYELLIGAPPFRRDEVPAMIHAHLSVEPPRASELAAGIPPMLDAVIARGMAKDPRARYSSAGELAAAARTAVLETRVTSSVDARQTTYPWTSSVRTDHVPPRGRGADRPRRPLGVVGADRSRLPAPVVGAAGRPGSGPGSRPDAASASAAVSTPDDEAAHRLRRRALHRGYVDRLDRVPPRAGRAAGGGELDRCRAAVRRRRAGSTGSGSGAVRADRGARGCVRRFRRYPRPVRRHGDQRVQPGRHRTLPECTPGSPTGMGSRPGHRSEHDPHCAGFADPRDAANRHRGHQSRLQERQPDAVPVRATGGHRCAHRRSWRATGAVLLRKSPRASAAARGGALRGSDVDRLLHAVGHGDQ